ncbi:MAG: Ig-like domain-containing protein [Sediminicola sp.]
MLLAILFTIFQLACSKDSDLLADQLLPSGEATIIEGVFTKEDFSTTTPGQSVVIDVLGNDEFPDPDGVKIIEVSQPKNGTITINADRTLTYSPTAPPAGAEAPTESITDNFEYTTEGGTTEENEVVQETAPVTVTITPPAPVQGENVYYVTVNGSKSNNGRSEAAAWSFEQAISSAGAGDIVYIKAGNYGNLQLELYKNGSANEPIQFIGYRNTPGDILANQGSTFAYGDAIDANKMPLLSGSAPNGLGSGMGIKVLSNYVQFSNIQFTGYSYAVMGEGRGIQLSNLIFSRIGDFRNNVGGFSDYNGVAIRMKGQYNSIKNSYVLNSGAEGIVLNDCDNCEILYSEVATDDNTNPTDYYILLTSGTENSKVDHCTVRRKSKLDHYGHGFVAKAGATYNTISNGTVINTTIEMSFADVHDNHIKNMTVVGTWNENKDTAGSIEVANGAHHNTFENITIDGVWSAIRFRDWNETASPYNQNDAGNNNDFINVTVSNSLNGIHFDEFSRTEGAAHNNTFTKCEFKNLNKLFQVNRPNYNNKLIGCTVENVPTLSGSSSGYNYILNPNTLFDTMNWLNITFKLP